MNVCQNFPKTCKTALDPAVLTVLSLLIAA